MMAASTFTPFSYATCDPSGRQALHRKLVVGGAKSSTSAFVERERDTIGRVSDGLIDVLSGWCHSTATAREAMQLPLVLRTVRGGALDPVWIAAQFAANLHAEGYEGKWTVSFAHGERLAVGWRSVCFAHNVAVDASANRTAISLDSGPPTDVASIPESARMFDIGKSRVPILGPETQSVFPVDDRAGFAGVPPQEVDAMLAETVSILGRYAPAYLGWVEGILSGLVPVPLGDGDFFQSFSLPWVPGLVFASFPAPALKIAELLVHETSHQYYHLAQLVTSFSNGKDAALYHSPYVQRDRPIDRILIAFHAFANVVLFYRACLEAGMAESADTAVKEIESNLNCLQPMSNDLHHSTGLTPAGRGLFEALRDVLFR